MVDSKPEAKDAEGANLGQAKPDETLRQKDPVPEQTLESSLSGFESAGKMNTDGVNPDTMVE